MTLATTNNNNNNYYEHDHHLEDDGCEEENSSSCSTSAQIKKAQQEIEECAKHIFYSNKYQDGTYEYRHVMLPKPLLKYLPADRRLLSEEEWRKLGVRQSLGWVHYMVHGPEPHIMLFRRSLEVAKQVQEQQRMQQLQHQQQKLRKQ